MASMSEQGVRPHERVIAEGERLVELARREGAPLWLAGGVAVQLHCAPFATASSLARTPGDIDVATVSGRGSTIGVLLERAGYRPNAEFNALNGRTRLLFYDDDNQRQLDVFVGAFEMCHQVPITARLAPESPAGLLPLPELLLTKLQIVRLNEKDLIDLRNLLLHFDIADHDERGINGGVIANACAADWGLWRTCRQTLETTANAASEPAVRTRATRLVELLDKAPKTRRWRLRARVGERVRWYQEPEEVGGVIEVA